MGAVLRTHTHTHMNTQNNTHHSPLPVEVQCSCPVGQQEQTPCEKWTQSRECCGRHQAPKGHALPRQARAATEALSATGHVQSGQWWQCAAWQCRAERTTGGGEGGGQGRECVFSVNAKRGDEGERLLTVNSDALSLPPAHHSTRMDCSTE